MDGPANRGFDLLDTFLEAPTEASGAQAVLLRFSEQHRLFNSEELVAALVFIESIWEFVNSEDRELFLLRVSRDLPMSAAVCVWLAEIAQTLPAKRAANLWQYIAQPPTVALSQIAKEWLSRG